MMQQQQQQPFYVPLIQDNPGEMVRRDSLEQPLDFYEPDVLPGTQCTTGKLSRLVVFCFIDMVSPPHF